MQPTMQQTIPVYDDPSLALIKSTAAQAIATQAHHPSRGVPVDHPFLTGIDHYCRMMLDGREPAAPAGDPRSVDPADPEVVAYLTWLHHRKAHADIAENKQIAADLKSQLERFRFGNPLWQNMFDEYVRYYWEYPHHVGGVPHYRSWKAPAFGNGDLSFGAIDWRLPSNATVALIGDIGTGTDVAAAVLVAAMSFKPDVILHVGDVYYSGTHYEFEHYFLGLFDAVFEDFGTRVPVFTLPGNHEYFTGAVPYFECLDSNRLIVGDSQRQKASYFSLQTEDGGWQFLGMDTSFHGHYLGVKAEKLAAALKAIHVDPSDASNPDKPPEMVFLRPDEVEWHQHQLDHFAGRTILLGHHQLYSANQKVGVDPGPSGTTDLHDYCRPGVNTELWKAFGRYFDKSVAAWFWGHEHNLGIYQDDYRPQGWPPPSADPDSPWKTLKKGRCVGHSAIPVAESEHPYQANYPVPLLRDDLKLDIDQGWYNRGFQIMKLSGAGNPVDVTYYQVAGADPKPLSIFTESIH